MTFYFSIADVFLLGMTFHAFYEAFVRIKRGFDSRRNFRVWAIDEICAQRRYAYRQRKRERLYSICIAIEANALEEPQEPMRHRQRPFGLPAGWNESGWEHIWRYILEFITDPKDILNLSETCKIFRRVLRSKYKAAKLAKVFKVCLVNGNQGIRLFPEITNAILPLRLVCKTTKISVDEVLLMKDKFHDIDCFYNHIFIGSHPQFINIPVNFPNFDGEQFRRIQLLSDFAAGVRRQRRVLQFVTAMEAVAVQNVRVGRTLPVKDIFLSEIGVHDIPGLLDCFQRLFQLVGGTVQSLFYNSEQSGHDAYNILRRYVPLFPNLLGLRISRRGPANEAVISNHIEPFPVAPKLKSFREMHTGFSVGFLVEILRSTPAIEHIDLCHYPENRLAAITTSGGILDQLALKTFNCGQIIPESFLQRQFNWPLRTIIFEGTPFHTIPCATLMNFVNGFAATLQELLVPTYPKGTGGGMLQLPKLTRLTWFLQKEAENLEFIKSLHSLEKLDMFIYYQVGRMSRTKEKILAFLKQNNVPCLFPAMKRIKVVMHRTARVVHWVKIWEMGDSDG